MIRFLILAAAMVALCWPQDIQWITHGPILGRPGARQMGVWARTAKPGSFRILYGKSPAKLDIISEPATTRLENDNTGWVLLKNLEPDTRYHYVVALDDGKNPASRPGSFRTWPAGEQFRDPKTNPDGLFNFSFEFACGNNQAFRGMGPTVPAFKTMLENLRDRINFAILDGDWLYEERREYQPEEWMAQNGVPQADLPPVLRIAPTLAGVWENYKLYLSRGHNLAEWHRHIPSFFTFDDHEILNDVFGAGEIGYRNRKAVFRDIGVRAWYDYIGWSNPVDRPERIRFGRAQLKAGSDVLADSDADFTRLDLNRVSRTLHVHWGTKFAGSNEIDEKDGDPNARVYELVEVLDAHRLRIRPPATADTTSSYSLGRPSYYRFPIGNAEFFALDCRGERNLHDRKEADKAGISMLGDRQREWLMESMRDSEAQFLFVVSSVNLMIPHLSSSGAGNKDDAWTAFLEEREKLIRFWDSLGKPVLVLTGDIHMSYTIKITDRVWEVASGPHNSPHHPVGGKGFPPNGKFNSGGRECDIRWTTYLANDIDASARKKPIYTVIDVKNVFNNPVPPGRDRWIQWPRPFLTVEHHEGLTGELLYAETIHANQ